MAKRSVEKIRKKYGKNCFRKWGSVESGGGSPVLLAWKRGRIPKSLVKSKKK